MLLGKDEDTRVAECRKHNGLLGYRNANGKHRTLLAPVCKVHCSADCILLSGVPDRIKVR